MGDLGLGRELSDATLEAHSKVGTPLYMSPEVLRGDGYAFSSDVWSVGCLLYEVRVACPHLAPQITPRNWSGTPGTLLSEAPLAQPAASPAQPRPLPPPHHVLPSSSALCPRLWYLVTPHAAQLANLKSPFKSEGLNLYGLFQKISVGEFPPVAAHYSEELQSLAKSMLDIDPTARPTMSEVLAGPFVAHGRPPTFFLSVLNICCGTPSDVEGLFASPLQIFAGGRPCLANLFPSRGSAVAVSRAVSSSKVPRA